MDPLNHDVLPGSDIPTVVTGIEHLGVHMKLYLCAKGALHPEAGHEYYHVVAGVGLSK